jgi:broad-specificity NMP kinase
LIHPYLFLAVINKRLFSAYAEDGSKIAKMGALRKELLREINDSSGELLILDGHLLCDIEIPNAMAIVLREHLSVLERRMQNRGYGKNKINENIISEATDYCGIHAKQNYSKVFELMSGSKDAFISAIKIAQGREVKPKNIELLKELLPLIEKEHMLLS